VGFYNLCTATWVQILNPLTEPMQLPASAMTIDTSGSTSATLNLVVPGWDSDTQSLHPVSINLTWQGNGASGSQTLVTGTVTTDLAQAVLTDAPGHFSKCRLFAGTYQHPGCAGPTI
jgi:hypothetical protein